MTPARTLDSFISSLPPTCFQKWRVYFEYENDEGDTQEDYETFRSEGYARTFVENGRDDSGYFNFTVMALPPHEEFDWEDITEEVRTEWGL
jgi:hypothetical protein